MEETLQSLIEEHCKGCKDYNNNCCFVTIQDFRYIGKCPCKDCLVKSMCSVACDEYARIDNMVNPSEKEYLIDP
jgi:hypothetical protein